jgi:hypothetical protein
MAAIVRVREREDLQYSVGKVTGTLLPLPYCAVCTGAQASQQASALKNLAPGPGTHSGGSSALSSIPSTLCVRRKEASSYSGVL